MTMKFNAVLTTDEQKDEQKSVIKFNKSFKTPDAIPQEGIERAIKLMQKGRLYRYNFSDDLSNYYELNDEDDQLATEVAKLEYEFSLYTKHKYAQTRT